MANQTVVSPGGQFPAIATSPPSRPLLAFRCMPAIKPYLAEDMQATIVVDAAVGFSEVAGAVPVQVSNSKIGLSKGQTLDVTIAVDGKMLTRGSVGLNTTGSELTLSISSLKPRTAAFNVTCSASLSAPNSPEQTFTASTSLLRLPNPPTSIGSVTKLDLRTGAFLRKDAPGGVKGQWETVFPIGFYTDFGGFLATNLSALDDLKAQG